jgi:hypothetical protein
MRNPHDTIWGFWGTDNKTAQVATTMCTLLGKYGANLDIIYEDPNYPAAKADYNYIYYWNSTTT